MRVTGLRFFLLPSVFLLAGCHAPPAANGPTTVQLRIADRDVFIDDTLTLLRELDYPPQRVDREAGLIVTRPTTRAQWFEPWRQDSRGGYQLLESSLHTVRGIVTLQLTSATPPDNSDDYELDVRVDKQRFSAPERQITTASGALSIYSGRVPTAAGQRGPRSEGAHWVPLGRDVLFEQYLIGRFARLGSVSGTPPHRTKENRERSHQTRLTSDQSRARQEAVAEPRFDRKGVTFSSMRSPRATAPSRSRL